MQEGSESCCVCSTVKSNNIILTNVEQIALEIRQFLWICIPEIKWDNTRSFCAMCVGELQQIYKFREKCLTAEAQRKQSIKVEPPSIDYNLPQIDHIPIENEAFKEYLVQENVEIEQVHPTCEVEDATQKSSVTCNESNTKKMKKWICICRKIFTNQNALKSHYSIHLDKKPYQCDVCANCYASVYTLNTHKKRVHGIGITKVVEEQVNKIEEVEIQDESESEPYKRQIKLLHQCDECPKSFTRKSRLNAHKRKIHLFNNVQDSSTTTQQLMHCTLPFIEHVPETDAVIDNY